MNFNFEGKYFHSNGKHVVTVEVDGTEIVREEFDSQVEAIAYMKKAKNKAEEILKNLKDKPSQ